MSFRRMYFKVESPEHSEKIQKALFELGYVWQLGSARPHKKVINTSWPRLRAWGDGEITSFEGECGDDWEDLEHTLEDLLREIEAIAPKKPAVDESSLNPKHSLGSHALPMTMVSPLYKAQVSLAKYNGRLKYGLSNYIGTQVSMSTYLDAIERHLDKLKMGEWVDEVDKCTHLGAIGANCDIIASAQAAGTLIDDRPRCNGQLEAYKALTPMVKSLQELHKDKSPKHYYLRDTEEYQSVVHTVKGD